MVKRSLALSPILFLAVNCSHKTTVSDEAPTSAAAVAGSAGEPTIKTVMDGGVNAYFTLGDAAALVESYQQFKVLYEDKGLPAATAATCKSQPQSPLCLALAPTGTAVKKSARAAKTRDPHSPASVRRALQQAKFEDLREVKAPRIISAVRGFSLDRIKGIVDQAMAVENCLAVSTYNGLAHVLEIHFPEPAVIDLAAQLFRKASECGEDEEALRASYRLALIKIWQGSCEEPKAVLDRLLSKAEIRGLHSRVAYWKAHCQEESAANPTQVASELFHSYPLSFHAVAQAQKQSDDLYLHVLKNVEPGVRFRTEGHDEMNNFVRLAEIMITDQKESLAALVLKNLHPEQVAQREPEFALYVSYLYYRAQMGLATFQTLSQLFSQNPKLQTPTTLQMFFPKWYYEQVVDNSTREGLDPFLIMALTRQESGFNPRAYSRAKARGLMQLLWITAKVFEPSRRPNDLFNPDINLRLGTKFLASLIRRYDGDIILALAAYNAGPLVVDAWRRRYPIKDSLLFVDMMPFRETREYVATILRNWYWYKAVHQPSSHPNLTFGVALSRDSQ